MRHISAFAQEETSTYTDRDTGATFLPVQNCACLSLAIDEYVVMVQVPMHERAGQCEQCLIVQRRLCGEDLMPLQVRASLVARR